MSPDTSPVPGTRAVWKFEMDVGTHALTMPTGARLLRAAEQSGRAFVWAEVDPDAATVERIVFVVGTGWPFVGGEYVDSFDMADGTLVFHLYDQGEVPTR